MKSYQAKAEYLCQRQEWTCPIWREKHIRICGAKDKGATAIVEVTKAEKMRAEDLHHYRVHDTVPNRRRFPFLVDSLLNLVAVNHAMHMEHDHWGRVSLREADRIEDFLRRHPRWAAWTNGEGL